MAALAKTRMDEVGRLENPRGGGRLGAAGAASLALHAGVAALVVGLTWMTLREPLVERQPEPFVLVPTASEARVRDASVEVRDPSARPGTSQPVAGERERLFVAPPSVRSWTPPPPPPPRVQESGETRSPTRTEPAVRDSRTISYEEHQRRQGISPETDRRAQVIASQMVAPTGVAPRIDMNQIRSDAGARPGAGASSTPDVAADSAMAGYFGEILRQLRDNHELPGGVSDLLSAEVRFQIAANGVVSDVRILRSSGSKDFDQSVLGAFGRLKLPARPDNKNDVQRLTFRMTE